MITTTLKTILVDSGCTLVVYEQEQLANLYTDQSDQVDIVGFIHQLNQVTLEVRANAIMEHYNPLTIEILAQVKPEDNADNNEAKLQELLDICKQVIIRLIGEATFKTLLPVTVNKVLENKYDANLIGWSIPLDITRLKNETRDPCL